MAILKAKEIAKMSEKEMDDKFKELRQELIKANISVAKSGKVKIKEIKRTIARLLTIKKIQKKNTKIS